MIITRVEAENLKGRTFAYDLSPQVAIVGDNFTGKTSIIDAIRLAVIGYIPELGKLPSATWQLASDEKMEVMLSFEDGRAMRFIARLEKGSPKITRDELSGEIPLLNAAAYFGMSERERYQYVFNIAKVPEDFTIDSVMAELQRLSFEEAHTEAIESAKKTILADLREPKADTIQEWLEMVITPLKSWFTLYNAREKDTQGAIRVLTELKNRKEAMAGNVRELTTYESAARENMQDAFKALNAVRQRAVDAKRYGERADRVAGLRKAVESTEEGEKLERLIKEAAASLKPKWVATANVEALKVAHDEAMRKFNEASAALNIASGERRDLEGRTECPYCGSKKSLTKLRAKLDEKVLHMREAVDGRARLLAEGKTELDAAIAETKRAEEALSFNRQVNENIVNWTDQSDRLLGQRHKWNQTLEKEEQELAKEKVEPVTNEELAAATKANDDAEQAYKATRVRLQEAQLLEHDLKRAAESQLAHEEAAAFVKVIKRIGETLRGKQAQLVDLVFGDLPRSPTRLSAKSSRLRWRFTTGK
jgi:hypothetical protein